MVSHYCHTSFCPCHRLFVLPLERLTITDQDLLSVGTKLSLQHFFLNKFELGESVKLHYLFLFDG